MKTILNKTLVIALLVMILLNMFTNVIYGAVEVNLKKAYLKKIGEADQHLKYYREDDKEYRYLICSVVGYYSKDKNDKEEFHPAYCMNKDLVGAEDTPYNVTVNSLLNNNKVWRVIKNGYPYKTAKQLGVANDYNAYAVTKWAVYCMLGESDIDCYKAEKDDEEAVAMLKALKSLVKIGNEGTEKQNANPISIKKVGNLKQEENNYTQEYQVTSKAEFQNYKISDTNGMPKGAKVTNINGEKQTKFNEGENFKVSIPKTSLDKNIDLGVEVSAECKSYVILEGKTTVTKTQNYVLTAGEYATATQKINLEQNTSTGSIKINKTDSETSKPIEGVEFALKNSNGDVVATATTDSNGVANFTNLHQGKYKLVEVKAHTNYVITKAEFDVDVEYDKTTTLDITNDRKRGNLKIYKVDADNNKIGLGNIQFELYSEEENKVIGTYTTNADGEIYIENLKTGTYKLKEKNTNKWYNVAEDIEVQVEWDKEKPYTEVIVENELKKGQVKVVKVDKDNNEIKLQGVKFNVIDEKGNVLEKITTNENGEAVTSRYPVRDYSKLYLQEVETKEEYKLNDKPIEIQLKENEVSTVQAENEVKKGKVKVIKVDKDNNEIKIEGAEFKIYDDEGNLVDTIVTDENGEATTKELPITKQYTIKETRTNDNYNLTDKTVTVKLKEGETTEKQIENELKKGQVKVVKVDKENHKIKLEGVKFNVLNDKGEVLETITTDEKGEAITQKYPIRDYEKLYIQEIETDKHYKLNEDITEVILEANEITTTQVENQVKKGKIKVIKVDKDNNEVKLQGVEFKVYDDDNNLVETIVTDKDGIAETKDLPVTSRYTIKETKTNKNYNLNEKGFTVEVKEDETTELQVENEKKKGKIKVIKLDKENHEIKLKGVEFNILNSKGEVVDTIVTDENGEAVTKNLPIDEEYKVQETKTLDNYVLTEETQTVKLEDNKTTNVEIENKKIKGKIRIIKTSKDDNMFTGQKAGTPLEGVEFDVYDSKKNKIQTIKTDKNGIAETEELEKGTYYIKEISTNEWYLLNEEKYQAEITKDGQVVDLKITNESTNPHADVEKTGPNEIEAGKEIEYDISVRNTGNTSLDNFTLTDVLPTEYIKLTKFETGTYNQDLRYDIYYKSNLASDEYTLMMEDLKTTENYKIDFSKELADNEYITELKLDFGTVDSGFSSNENPHIYAQVKEDAKNNDIFENTAEVNGEYNGKKVTDISKWKTKIIKILPITGF